MPDRLKSLDMLRAVAASMVVLFHSNNQFRLGAAGVDLFFVISGFVIASITVDRPNRSFLLDRAARIFPIYWIALLPWGMAALSEGSLNIMGAVSDLLLLPRAVLPSEPLLLLSWTLVFELIFYSGYAATLLWRSYKPVIGLYLLSCCLWALTGAYAFRWIGNPMVVEFFLGIGVFQVRKDFSIGMLCGLIGLAALLIAPQINLNISHFGSAFSRMFWWGIPAALMVYCFISIGQKLTAPICNSLAWMGTISYSIYLFHPLALALFHGPWPLRFLLGLAAGVAGWWIFERPIERLRRDRQRKKLRSPGPTNLVEA